MNISEDDKKRAEAIIRRKMGADYRYLSKAEKEHLIEALLRKPKQ